MFSLYNIKVLLLYYLFKYISSINIFYFYCNNLYKNKDRFNYFKKCIKTRKVNF